MLKLLPVILIVCLVIGAAIYFLFFQKALPKVELSGFESKVGVTQEEPETIFEANSEALSKASSAPRPTSTPGSLALDGRVKSLETALVALQNRIEILERATPAPNTQIQSSSKTPVYIPLGSGGTADGKNWFSMNGYQVSIDPADYPGYKTAQLEITMRLVESVGEAHAQLYNSTDSRDVSSSSVSTTSDKAVLLTSTGFTLASGKKTYVVQLKSTQGYQIELQSARIKINF